MTEETVEVTVETPSLPERDENIKRIFNALYDCFKEYTFVGGKSQIDLLRVSAKALYETVEKIAEHRAKVICGEFIVQIRDDIGTVLDTLKKDKKRDKNIKSVKKDSDAVIQALPRNHPDKE